MKSTAIACAIAAAALGFGSLSYAQGSDWRDRDGRGGHDRYTRDGGHYEQRHDTRIQRPRQDQYQHDRQHGQYGQRGGQRGQYSQSSRYSQYSQYGQHGQYQQHNANRGPYGQWTGHTPRYRRGDHLPYQFRQHQYHVNDWRAHRLYAPPQGYHWVQADGGDYLLVALATGLIANLLLNQ